MSKNKNIKQQMLRLAKGIAEAEFSQEILRIERINKTLKEHPEFEQSEFKKMVIGFQQKQAENLAKLQEVNK